MAKPDNQKAITSKDLMRLYSRRISLLEVVVLEDDILFALRDLHDVVKYCKAKGLTKVSKEAISKYNLQANIAQLIKTKEISSGSFPYLFEIMQFMSSIDSFDSEFYEALPSIPVFFKTLQVDTSNFLKFLYLLSLDTHSSFAIYKRQKLIDLDILETLRHVSKTIFTNEDSHMILCIYDNILSNPVPKFKEYHTDLYYLVRLVEKSTEKKTVMVCLELFSKVTGDRDYIKHAPATLNQLFFVALVRQMTIAEDKQVRETVLNNILQMTVHMFEIVFNLIKASKLEDTFLEYTWFAYSETISKIHAEEKEEKVPFGGELQFSLGNSSQEERICRLNARIIANLCSNQEFSNLFVKKKTFSDLVFELFFTEEKCRGFFKELAIWIYSSVVTCCSNSIRNQLICIDGGNEKFYKILREFVRSLLEPWPPKTLESICLAINQMTNQSSKQDTELIYYLMQFFTSEDLEQLHNFYLMPIESVVVQKAQILFESLESGQRFADLKLNRFLTSTTGNIRLDFNPRKGVMALKEDNVKNKNNLVLIAEYFMNEKMTKIVDSVKNKVNIYFDIDSKKLDDARRKQKKRLLDKRIKKMEQANLWSEFGKEDSEELSPLSDSASEENEENDE